MEQKLATSLDGARRGRRVGFLTAQQRAAQIVLDEVQDRAEALRLYKLVMALVDE